MRWHERTARLGVSAAERDAPIDQLLAVMARLRDPEGGCPWDLDQTFASVAPYTIEEAYEVADAIERGDLADLKDELGDLLLQVVFHARMAEEQGAFGFDDVARAIVDKMIRRHPHVFAGEVGAGHAHPTRGWEAIKAEERAVKAREGGGAHRAGVLDDVPPGFPALLRAVKLTRRAARVGFDWPSLEPVLAKVREELGELEVEIAAGDRAKAREEMGDLLFVMANLAASWTLIRRTRSAPPTPSSFAAFTTLRTASPPTAADPSSPTWPRWTGCGTRRRRPSEAERP